MHNNPKKDPKVVWQRHDDMAQEDAMNAKTAIANDEAEVTATCHCLPYQPRDGIKQMVDTITPHLVLLLQ